MNDLIKEYCTGCGLCKSACSVEFTTDSKGFQVPKIEKPEQIDFCKSACMSLGEPSNHFSGNDVWGKFENVFLGWSCDKDVRREASSGGVLTSLCGYLLEEKIVDGIIQTVQDEKIPYNTKTVISKTPDDVKRCMGSRYSASAPLAQILDVLNEGGKYAFVGKPCDVAILRIYLSKHLEFAGEVRYFLSFFCAGQPSVNAQLKLLKQLGCEKVEDCKALQYRGNGWPGFATALKYDGTSQRMSYNDSWGKILGRDVRKCCRLCLDGIGELADIACGDAWYISNDGKPSFLEGEGRNVIFARTKTGSTLLQDAMKGNYITLNIYSNYSEELKKIQKYQYDRRVTMKSMLTAMKLMGKKVPHYNKEVLKELSKNATLNQKVKRFVGTIKRIKQGKL